MIRVVLPAHLKTLAHVSGEVRLAFDGPVEPAGPVTQRLLLDALETRYPMLLGTIRDRRSGQRRPFVRFYACEEDLSNESPDAPLPDRVVSGEEPLIILGAMAGG
jgi:molybdopterin synthase sulfur carrier subunit